LTDGSEPAVDGPPRNRMAVALLALLGLLVSLYMLAHALGLTGPVMCGLGDCETVQDSAYAWVGPIPVSGLGVAGYLALLVVSLLGLQPPLQRSRAVSLTLLGGGVVGVGFSVYLTYLEAFVIHAWCQWCVVSAVLMMLAFVASLPELRALRSPAGP
jgi:uncharacterized membrane protein